MVDAIPNIIKEGAEYDKRRQHGCDIFFIWNTCMMSTRTARPSLEDIFVSER